MRTLKCVSVYSKSVESPIGLLHLTACENGLHGLSCRSSDIVDNNQQTAAKPSFIINQTIQWLDNYFRNKAAALNSNDNTSGVNCIPKLCTTNHSEFHVKVWTTLMTRTSLGETITYGDLSNLAVGHRNSSRAVGTAMRMNPFMLLVPCHRVIKADGGLGQYSGGGASVKEFLIDHEKSIVN